MNIESVRLRSGRNVPRVHGNGFIQLDLEPGTRLHVWGHRNLPRQTVDTGIHDHKFGFRSTAIVGRVVNILWTTIDYPEETYPGVASHKVYVPRGSSIKSENTTLSDSGERVKAYPASSRTVLIGEAYYMEPRAFHETISDRPSATIMTKGYEVPHVARILVPMGQEPDNDFNRDAFPVARLWEIIEEVLRT